MTKLFGYPRKHRLQHDLQYQAVYAGRVKVQRGPLTVFAIPNELGFARLGLSVSRRVGTAPRRNRIKRLLREAFRLMQRDWPRGYDLVINVRPHVPGALADYQQWLAESVQRLHDRWQQKPAERSREEPPSP